MKKLIFPAILALGMISFSATAQETEPMKKDSTQMEASNMQAETNYKKIDKSVLPQPIKDAVLNDLDGMMVTEAYSAPDKTYKIVVSNMDKTESKTLYATEDGKWIEPKE